MRKADFEDMQLLLRSIDPERLPHSMVLELAARIAITASEDPKVMKQAQEIVGGK